MNIFTGLTLYLLRIQNEILCTNVTGGEEKKRARKEKY